jgi:hypothetical protein
LNLPKQLREVTTNLCPISPSWRLNGKALFVFKCRAPKDALYSSLQFIKTLKAYIAAQVPNFPGISYLLGQAAVSDFDAL